MCSGPHHFMGKKKIGSENIVKYVLIIKKKERKVDFRRSMFNLSYPYPRLQKESKKPSQSQDIGLGNAGGNLAPEWFLCYFIVDH